MIKTSVPWGQQGIAGVENVMSSSLELQVAAGPVSVWVFFFKFLYFFSLKGKEEAADADGG